MKKTTIFISIILIVLIGGVLFIQNVNLNRIGADEYYVQIAEGKRMESKTGSGEIYTTYEYALPGFDKNGKEQTLTFTAIKELRQQAYLCVYVRDNIVRSYKEVQVNEIPGIAKQKLEEIGQP